MAPQPVQIVVQHLRDLAGEPDSVASDQELIGRLAGPGHDAAFAPLVWRRGPTVRDVCRRLPGQEADTDDAFQATLLALVPRARSVRERRSLARWLYGVAYRVAGKFTRAVPPVKLKLLAVVLLAAAVAAGAGMGSHLAPVTKPHPHQAEGFQAVAQVAAQARPAQHSAARADRYGDPLPEGAVARLGTVRFRLFWPNWFACAPDGRTVAVGADDGVHLWDAATGATVRRLAVRGLVYAAAFSPDGKTLAGAEEDCIRVWDVKTGRQQAQLAGELHPSLRGFRLVFAPDGQAIASGNALEPVFDGATRLWDLSVGKQRWSRGGNHAGTVPMYPLGFLPDSKTVVVREFDGSTLYFLDAATGREQRRTKLPRSYAVMLLSPDGRTLVTGPWNDRATRLWDLATGKERRQLRAGTTAVTPKAFSPDGKLLATAGADHVFRLWDVASGRERSHSDGAVGQASWLTLFPDGRTVAFRLSDETTVRHWDLRLDRELHALAGHRDAVTSLAFSPDGRLVWSAGRDDTIRCWERASGRQVREVAAGQDGVWQLALGPDGKALATGGAYSTVVRFWDAATGKEVRHQRLRGSTTALALSPVTNILAAGWFNGDLEKPEYGLTVLDAASGRERLRLRCPTAIDGTAFAPDGRLLATACGRTLQVWSTATGREAWHVTLPRDFFPCLTFAPDGRTLASGWTGPGPVGERGILLWEVASARERCDVPTDLARIQCAAFSPGGSRLAGAGFDNKVYLWDTATGKELRQFVGHRNMVTAVAFSPDGNTLASASDDTTILLWDVAGPPVALGRRPRRLRPADVESAWRDLAGADAARAWRAVCTLAAAPEDAVPFLRRRLRPVPAVDEGEVARLLTDLDSRRFAVREAATSALEKLGELAVPFLEKALASKPTPEVRRRVERLLAKLADPGASPARLQALRAVEVLEHAGGRDARRVLETLSNGAPQARLTQEAKASVEWLRRQATAER